MVRQDVQQPVGPLTHVANPLAQIDEQRFAAQLLHLEEFLDRSRRTVAELNPDDLGRVPEQEAPLVELGVDSPAAQAIEALAEKLLHIPTLTKAQLPGLAVSNRSRQ